MTADGLKARKTLEVLSAKSEGKQPRKKCIETNIQITEHVIASGNAIRISIKIALNY